MPATARNEAHTSALLLLADGRFPAGGHAHSGGLEPAVAAGRVHDVASLQAFLLGRAATAGLVAAAFTAASCARFGADAGEAALLELDAELDARTPSPALRRASRTLGRQLLRATGTVCPHPRLDALRAGAPGGMHQPIVLGAAAAALGLPARAAAAAALHEATTGPAGAAVRLLGLDPFAVHAVLARLGAHLDTWAEEAAGYADSPAERLPAASAVMLDISAQHHATWEVRLFAS